MNKWTTISTEDDSYQISAIFDKDGSYTMPSLAFKLDGVETELWDSEDYLLGIVYPYLKGKLISTEMDEYFSNVKEDVLEIFEEAIRMKMFGREYDEHIKEIQKKNKTL